MQRSRSWLLARPLLWAAVLCGVTASAYSQTAAGGWALLVLAALTAWWLAPRLPRVRTTYAPRPTTLSLTILAVSAALLLAPTLEGPRWRAWDYGAHHALTRVVARAFQEGSGMPTWVMSLSTGDAPFDLYPWITYAVAALGALALGGEPHVPTALSLLALGIHTGIAICVAQLARRFAPWPVALLAGLVVLVDPGSFETGVYRSMVAVGLLHSGLAELMGLIALVLAFEALRHPTRGRLGLIVAAAALAAAVHPTGLLLIAIALLALLISALLARDDRPARALVVGLHLGLGCALSAVIWRPFAERHFLYGLHFAYPAQPAGVVLSDVLGFRWPPTDFPVVYALGLIGLLAAFASRRADQLWAALLVVVALAGLAATPYLGLGLASMGWFARFQPWRVGMLSYPFIMALAAAGAACVVRGLARLGTSGGQRRWVTASLVGMLAVGGVRAASESFVRQRARLREFALEGVPDPEGFAKLVAWAGVQAIRQTPQRYGRLFFEEGSHSVYHVTAETGLPTLYIGAGGGSTMLGHRMVDASAESLRRFNVRWSMALGQSPRLGDPASERCFGSYCVRDIDGWDGRLARVEKGQGLVRVTRLRDEHVELQLEGTDEPALVAVGFGSYPRWEARAVGRSVPVYSYPATPGSSVRVPALWIPPGTTHLTPERELPSDRSGSLLTVLAVLVLAVIALAGAAPRWRYPALRKIARVKRAARVRVLGRGVHLMPVAGVALLAWGIHEVNAPAAALTLGHALTGAAHVEVRLPWGGWQPCSFSALVGGFDCGAGGRVHSALAFIVKDHIASTPYPTPAISFSPRQEGTEVQIRLRRRLDGEYVAQKWGEGRAVLITAPDETLPVPPAPRVVRFAASAPRDIVVQLRSHGTESLGVTLVRSDRLGSYRTGGLPWVGEEPPAVAPPGLDSGDRRR